MNSYNTVLGLKELLNHSMVSAVGVDVCVCVWGGGGGGGGVMSTLLPASLPQLSVFTLLLNEIN